MRAPTNKVNKGIPQEDTCASPEGNARLQAFPSVDEPPFDTTEPGALFPIAAPKKREGARKDSRELTLQQETWFAEWWKIYWRPVAKKAAREAFGKHVSTEARFQQVMAATRAQAAEMLERPKEKRPHGATWLNGERWEDETAETPQQQAIGATIYTKCSVPREVNSV
jgi:hypothetical protein